MPYNFKKVTQKNKLKNKSRFCYWITVDKVDKVEGVGTKNLYGLHKIKRSMCYAPS